MYVFGSGIKTQSKLMCDDDTGFDNCCLFRAVMFFNCIPR